MNSLIDTYDPLNRGWRNIAFEATNFMYLLKESKVVEHDSVCNEVFKMTIFYTLLLT